MPASGQLKQRTVGGKTITLHQLDNTFPELEDTPYMYEIRVNGAALGDPVFRRDVAMDEFEATVRAEGGGERGGRREDRGGMGEEMGGGLFGGGLF